MKRDVRSRAGEIMLVSLVVIYYIVLYLGGLALHLWTGYIAYRTSGFIIIVLTLFLPGFAETVWFVVIWRETGVFLNWYTLAVLSLVIWYSLSFVGNWLIGLIETKVKARRKAAAATRRPPRTYDCE
jgi:hypothetical protein